MPGESGAIGVDRGAVSETAGGSDRLMVREMMHIRRSDDPM